MKRYSPEERRGVVAVVAIALILCLCGIGLNFFGPEKRDLPVEIVTVKDPDSVEAPTTSAEKKSKKSGGSRKNKGKSGKTSNAVPRETPSRDFLGDSIQTRKK